MKPFNNKDIADYYNQTLHHYKRWWMLAEELSVHYGYWDDRTHTFAQALRQTMVEMAERAEVKKGCCILDAGCGVGGASFFLADQYGARVKGITLSEKQLTYANEIKGEGYPNVQFSLQDFTQTNFPDEYFDLIWACESSCYAFPKEHFLKETKRLLKPGGRLIVADYFMVEDASRIDHHHYLKKWADSWAITELHDEKQFVQLLEDYDFRLLRNDDVTQHILRSARRMYMASLAGAIPSMLYNLTHNASHFGATHYRSGYYQFKALKKEFWRYRMVLAEKS